MPLKHHTQNIPSKPNQHNPRTYTPTTSLSTSNSSTLSHPNRIVDNHFYRAGEFTTPLSIRTTNHHNRHHTTTPIKHYGIDYTSQHYDRWSPVEKQVTRVGVGAVFGNERQLPSVTVYDVYPQMTKDVHHKKVDENHSTINHDTSSTSKVTQSSLHSLPTKQHHTQHQQPKPYAFTIPTLQQHCATRHDAIKEMQDQDKHLKQHKLQSKYYSNQHLLSNVLDSKLEEDSKRKQRDIMNLRSKVRQREIYYDSLSKREGQF